MIEEPDFICPSCGGKFSKSADTAGLAVCPNCRTQRDSLGSEVDAEHSTAGSEDISAETMSVAPGATSSVRKKKRSTGSVPKKIGRFEIEEELGSGGFGTVYRAYDPMLEREVALKVPRLTDDDRREELFLHEAKASARLRHPNIVAVYECGKADDQPYIASEFVDGTPLSHVLRFGRIETGQTVEIVRQIAEAIQYAHGEGIVHRDLKPDNIMMSRSARPQVMDFGLARLGSDSKKSLMTEGSIVGTPAFMAPEQARGDKDAVGPKSDQYSLGVLLYLMLCGKMPYRGEAWSIISRVADPDVQPKAPRAFVRDVPRDLEACCLKAMEKNPHRRYEDLSGLADDLGRWLEGRPLLARPIGLGERLVRWCERNRLIAGLLAAIGALVLSTLIVGYVLAFKFSNLADYANERADAAQQAKMDVERLLIDTFTESGLDATRNQRAQEAVLWFGSAARLAKDHPQRERMNRTRFRTWLAKTPIPVRMFRGLQRWHKSLTVHPSGQYVLSEQHGAKGDRCQIWNVASGEPWELPCQPLVTAATWNTDGTVLALASGNEVQTFRFPDGDQLDRWQHPDRVSCLRFTSDDQSIAVGGQSSVGLRAWQKESSTRNISMPAPVSAISWAPEGSRFATLCTDRKVYIWDTSDETPNNEPILSPLPCPFQSELPPVRFLSESLLVVPESDHAVRCWDIASGHTVWSVPCGSDAGLAVSPDRRRVAIINRNRVLQVDASNGQQLGEPMTHPNLVYTAAYDPTGKRLLTGCADQFARVLATDSGQLLSSIGHSDIVHRVAWFPDGRACVTAHWKADLVRVWKLGVASDGGFTRPLPGGVMHVKWGLDGAVFLPCGFDLNRAAGPCSVLKTTDGRPAGKPIPFPGRVSDGCFVPGRNTVVMAGSSTAAPPPSDGDRLKDQDLEGPGLLVAADIESGQHAWKPMTTPSNIIAVAASPDGRIVAALCHDHTLLMVDPNDGMVMHRHKTFPTANFFYGFVVFRRLIFSPSGDKLAVWGSRSRTVEMRDPADGELLFTLHHENDSNLDWLHDVVFSPDGKTIATCSADQTVQLWNAEDGQKLPMTLLHTGWVFSAVFSQDGRRLLTACQDRQARLWDLDNPDKPVLITPAQSDEVYATCFLPGEDSFLIGLRNGEVSAWDARQGKMISPSTIEPDQEAIYTLALAPNQSRVIVISRDRYVRGFPPQRWQPRIDHNFTAADLQSLGEMIASQELFDGVLMGLSNEAVIDRWRQLFGVHAEHEIFRWPLPTHPSAALDSDKSESDNAKESM